MCAGSSCNRRPYGRKLLATRVSGLPNECAMRIGGVNGDPQIATYELKRKLSQNSMIRILSHLLLFTLILLGSNLRASANSIIPIFWDTKEQLSTPQLDTIGRIAFLTTIDFPPFNYIDDTGRLSGFHIDLAKAICVELNVTDKCSIQALPWRELESSLLSGSADAILAGMKATLNNRKHFSFGRPYLRFPARFVVRDGSKLSGDLSNSTTDRRIGVIAGSAHEAMLRDYFPAAKPVLYDRPEWLLTGLIDGKLDAAFGDGMQLAFWLGSAGSQNCCRFAGGPYLSDKYLSTGLSIVTSLENKPLRDAMNYALRELTSNGTYSELYLRYFPVSFY